MRNTKQCLSTQSPLLTSGNLLMNAVPSYMMTSTHDSLSFVGCIDEWSFLFCFFYILAKLQESFDKSVILSDEIPYCWSLLRQKMFVYSSCKGSKRQREVVSGFPHCPTALTIWMLCLAPPPSTGTGWAVTRRGPSLFGMEAVCSHSHVFCGLITTVCILLVHVRVKVSNDTSSCNIIQQHNPGP